MPGAEQEALVGGPSDHDAVIRAQGGLGEDDGEVKAARQLVGFLSQLPITRRSTGHEERPHQLSLGPQLPQSKAGPIHQVLEGRFLKDGRNVSRRLAAHFAIFAVDHAAYRGFQATERKISGGGAPRQRFRDDEAVGVALRGKFFERGGRAASRRKVEEGQVQHPRHFVK
jgi:hypothetical protein